MGKLLVHIATGPQNPTRAALGLLIARTAREVVMAPPTRLIELAFEADRVLTY